MIQGLFNSQAQLALEFALDAAGTRAQLIAHNIANADTPNFKAQRLRFEDLLAQELGGGTQSAGLQLRRTNPLHLPGHSFAGLSGERTPRGIIYTDDQTTYRLDGNNVDIDQETAQQAKNAIHYSILTELVSRRIQTLRSAISEGRR